MQHLLRLKIELIGLRVGGDIRFCENIQLAAGQLKDDIRGDVVLYLDRASVFPSTSCTDTLI
jgi:hypothetical protein